MRQTIEGSQKTWDKFLKPTLNTLAPFISMAVGVKNKNPRVGQATRNNFRRTYFQVYQGKGFLFNRHAQE